MSTPPPGRPQRRPLPRGWLLEDYQVEQTLGIGGFGITYLARDGRLQLPVAIKEYFPMEGAARDASHCVRPDTGDEAAARRFRWGLERLLDEARALAALRHPNVVRVLRFFHANDTAYIVMEYEPGLALPRWRPPTLARETLLALVMPLLDGLEAVHAAGFLHRDIKPSNVVVREDGSPVLLDFGASRRVFPGREMTAIYSPGYAPPEQYQARGEHGPWTDLYALGAVMYWLATGQVPQDAMARGAHDELQPLQGQPGAGRLGGPLCAAIDAALQLEVRRRPQSADAFRALLQAAATAPLAPDAPTAGTAGVQEAALQALERALAQHVGPLAHWLVRHEAAAASDAGGLLAALAGEIPAGAEREQFLAEARQALRQA